MSPGLILFMVVFGVLFIGGAWFLTSKGPGKGGRGVVVDSGELEEKRGRLEEMVSGAASWTVEDLDKGKVEELEVAAKLKQELSTKYGGLEVEGYSHVVDLLSLWGKQESLDLEKRARVMLNAGGRGLALGVDLLERAAKQQRSVNAKFPDTAGVDRPRVFQLERELKDLQVVPFLAEVEELEKAGRAALESGRAEEALKSFQEAARKQRELSTKFVGSAKVDLGKLRELSALVKRAESWDDMKRLEGLLSSGEQAVAAGRLKEGALSFKRAQKGFRELQQKQGVDVGKSLVIVEEGLEKAVMGHYTQAFARGWRGMYSGDVGEAVVGMRAIYDELEKEFGEFAERFAGEEERLVFVEKRKDRWADMHNSMRRDFVEIPAMKGWWLLRCEVWQDLYVDLMDVENPSREQGSGELPVESVSIEEAELFAKRASWLLGEKVVLPSRELFFAAAGKPRSAEEIGLQSIGQIAKVRSGVPNGAGCYHLWGNVSEWLVRKDGGAAEAFHAGGHFGDTPQTVFSKQVRQSTVRDRSRLVGFRVALYRGGE